MILVTGHKGYIGSRLIKKLDAIGIDIKSSKDILSCDLPDADIVYHLAAQAGVPSSWEDPIYDARQNILASIKIAQRYKDSKIIYTSSAAAEKESSPYGLSKSTAEKYLNMIANNVVTCVLPNIFGNKGKGVVHRFINDNPIKVEGGEQTRTFVYVDDIVDALVKAKDWDNGKYYLGGMKPVSINELVMAVSKRNDRMPMRKGDILKSEMPNTTPNWEPKINVLKYLNESCCSNDSL